MEQQEQHFRSGFRKPHLPILKNIKTYMVLGLKYLHISQRVAMLLIYCSSDQNIHHIFVKQ